ncbi:hypothetical protein MPER_08781, partial [Moniliophthora perniciosa FA553]
MPLVKDRIVLYPADKPLKKQSIEVPGTKRPGQTGHYRNGLWGLRQADQPNAFLTLPQVFDAGLKVGREQPLLGHRPLISKNLVYVVP